VVLANNGTVQDVVYTDDFKKLMKNYDGKMVVGISRLKSDPGPTMFAGVLSEDLTSMVMAPLLNDVRFNGDELTRIMGLQN
jgi:hypothetical protein